MLEQSGRGEDDWLLVRALGNAQPMLVVAVVQQWIREREAAGLASVDAVAILLQALGEDAASRILPQLSRVEVESLGAALLNHGIVAKDRIRRVLSAFLATARTMAVLSADPRAFLRACLIGAFGESQAQVLEVASLAQQGRSVADILHSLSDQIIADHLRSEAVQVAAVLLAHLETDRAVCVLRLLDESTAQELVSRLARARAISPTALLDLRDGLLALLVAQGFQGDQPQTGIDAAKSIVDGLYPQGAPAAWAGAVGAGLAGRPEG